MGALVCVEMIDFLFFFCCSQLSPLHYSLSNQLLEPISQYLFENEDILIINVLNLTRSVSLHKSSTHSPPQHSGWQKNTKAIHLKLEGASMERRLILHRQWMDKIRVVNRAQLLGAALGTVHKQRDI